VPLKDRKSSVTCAVTWVMSGLAFHSTWVLPSTCQVKRRLPEPVPPLAVSVSR
jgi:hypothetical protein